jgi:hypothetical protein
MGNKTKMAQFDISKKRHLGAVYPFWAGGVYLFILFSFQTTFF